MFRSLLSYIFVREFLVQDVLYLHILYKHRHRHAHITVRCRNMINSVIIFRFLCLSTPTVIIVIIITSTLSSTLSSASSLSLSSPSSPSSLASLVTLVTFQFSRAFFGFHQCSLLGSLSTHHRHNAFVIYFQSGGCFHSSFPKRDGRGVESRPRLEGVPCACSETRGASSSKATRSPRQPTSSRRNSFEHHCLQHRLPADAQVPDDEVVQGDSSRSRLACAQPCSW